MDNINVQEYSHRFDSYLCQDILEKCVARQVSLVLTYQDMEFYSRVIHFDLEAQSPFVVLDSLMPREGNQLARKRTEVDVSCNYIREGDLYHVKFRTILWGVGQKKNLLAIYCTPPLDVKTKVEHFIGIPTHNNPLWVKIPLFKDEIRLEVTRISNQGLTFEDRLVSDSFPALSNIGRVQIDFGNENEVVVHGTFKRGGKNTVGFFFEKVPNEEMSYIESYLEEIYSTQSTQKARDKDARRIERAKKSEIKVVKIILLTNDMEYAKKLLNLIKDKVIKLAVQNNLQTFYEKVKQEHTNVVLIDETFKDLDLWTVSRSLRTQLQERDNLPPFVLLSDNITEDSVVYAQYCGVNKVIARSDFLSSFFEDIGSITGRRDLIREKRTKNKGIIVVIDDDKNVVFTLEHALKEQGYHPILASTGSEGVRLAKDLRPSCIVLEIAVRSGDGLGACRMLKKMPFTRKIPIIVLTASRDGSDRETAFQNGVEDYLVKPVETSAILSKISELTENE